MDNDLLMELIEQIKTMPVDDSSHISMYLLAVGAYLAGRIALLHKDMVGYRKLMLDELGKIRELLRR